MIHYTTYRAFLTLLQVIFYLLILSSLQRKFICLLVHDNGSPILSFHDTNYEISIVDSMSCSIIFGTNTTRGISKLFRGMPVALPR